MAGRSKAASLEAKWPRKETASENCKVRQPCLSHRDGAIWLKQKKKEKKKKVCVCGPAEPHSTHTILRLLQRIWGSKP